MRFEVLTDRLMFRRGAAMLDAMIATAPVQIDVRPAWSGKPCTMMVYGAGHPGRRPQQLANLAAGGRMIAWDLGYWNKRQGDSFTMRATIDHDHPYRLLRPERPERWDRAGIALRQEAESTGPIVVVGMGPKSHRMLGLDGPQWERHALERCAALYPNRPIVYRPKQPHHPKPPGRWRVVADVPIEQVLHGASLVVARHSNVAIDACIAGVPVVCEDGAARALYSNDLRAPTIPNRDDRLQFLRSLAWWQWQPEEARDAWTYLLSRL